MPEIWWPEIYIPHFLSHYKMKVFFIDLSSYMKETKRCKNAIFQGIQLLVKMRTVGCQVGYRSKDCAVQTDIFHSDEDYTDDEIELETDTCNDQIYMTNWYGNYILYIFCYFSSDVTHCRLRNDCISFT